MPGWVERRRQIENFLADRFGGGLPPSFPVVDRFLNGAATSVKSLDLAAKTYQTGSRVLSTLTSYIDKLSNFGGDKFGGVVVSNITSKTLEVVVPANATPQQVAAFVKAAQYASEAGITSG